MPSDTEVRRSFATEYRHYECCTSRILKCEVLENAESLRKFTIGLIIFKTVDICHRMEPFWLFCSMSLICISRLNFWNGYFYKLILKKCKHYCQHQIGCQIFAVEWHHCECCTSWSWSTFSRSHILKCKYLETVRANEKYSSITSMYVDICHRLWLLWMVYSVTLNFIFKVKHFLVTQMTQVANVTAKLPWLARSPPWSCS